MVVAGATSVVASEGTETTTTKEEEEEESNKRAKKKGNNEEEEEEENVDGLSPEHKSGDAPPPPAAAASEEKKKNDEEEEEEDEGVVGEVFGRAKHNPNYVGIHYWELDKDGQPYLSDKPYWMTAPSWLKPYVKQYSRTGVSVHLPYPKRAGGITTETEEKNKKKKKKPLLVVVYANDLVKRKEEPFVRQCLMKYMGSVFSDHLILPPPLPPPPPPPPSSSLLYTYGVMVVHRNGEKVQIGNNDNNVEIEDYVQWMPAQINFLYTCHYKNYRDAATMQEIVNRIGTKTVIWVEPKDGSGLVTLPALSYLIDTIACMIQESLPLTMALNSNAASGFKDKFQIWIVEPGKPAPYSPFLQKKEEELSAIVAKQISDPAYLKMLSAMILHSQQQTTAVTAVAVAVPPVRTTPVAAMDDKRLELLAYQRSLELLSQQRNLSYINKARAVQARETAATKTSLSPPQTTTLTTTAASSGGSISNNCNRNHHHPLTTNVPVKCPNPHHKNCPLIMASELIHLERKCKAGCYAHSYKFSDHSTHPDKAYFNQHIAGCVRVCNCRNKKLLSESKK
jgi:hypothetical protein